MKADEIQITTGENLSQKAFFEINDKTIDYETSKNLEYSDIISITKGLNVISEFYDVIASVAAVPTGICAVSLGKTLEEAVMNVMDSNPIDFMESSVLLTRTVDSDLAKILKEAHMVVAPEFTQNAIEYFETHDICYVTIKTPLKDYKKYISSDVKVTPLGTITQAQNLKELDKDSFKIVTKTKPTVEQIEDAVFAWKVSKHMISKAIVIAKDLKTTAVSQGLQSASIEYVLDYSCEKSKDAILASDTGISIHDMNAAAQGRISLVILPFVSKELTEIADKYNISVITTGFTNILY